MHVVEKRPLSANSAAIVRHGLQSWNFAARSNRKYLQGAIQEMKRVVLASLVLIMSMSANAGILSGAAEVVKGAAKDAAVVAKIASYPVRHPRKSAHATKKAVVKSAKAVAKL